MCNTKINEECKVLVSLIADLENEMQSKKLNELGGWKLQIQHICQNMLIVPCTEYPKHYYLLISL